MEKLTIKIIPYVKKKNEIKKHTQTDILNKVYDESQVIIHCIYRAITKDINIRIWKSTFLYDKESNHKSKLLHHENITLYPEWTQIRKGQSKSFTLIFSSLPKHCKLFDLIEEIPEPGGFMVYNMKRCNHDIYGVEFKC